MEALVAQALTRAGIGYSRDEGGGNPSGLDFGLENGVQIEVKRFHTDRIAEQMSRAPDVVAVQGEGAVGFVAGLLNRLADMERVLRMVAPHGRRLQHGPNVSISGLTYQRVCDVLEEATNAPPDAWLVWSHEHNAFWRANEAGYTRFIESAGRYTRAEAEAICRDARPRAGPATKPNDLPPEICFPAPEMVP